MFVSSRVYNLQEPVHDDYNGPSPPLFWVRHLQDKLLLPHDYGTPILVEGYRVSETGFAHS